MLQKGDDLFKSISKFRYLRVEDMPQRFFIVNVDFLDNRIEEITAELYLVSIT